MLPQVMQPLVKFLYGELLFTELTTEQAREKLDSLSRTQLGLGKRLVQQYSLRRKIGERTISLSQYLQREITEIKPKLADEDLPEVLFLLCLLSYEGFELDSAKHYLKQLDDGKKFLRAPIAEARYHLLRALILDASNDARQMTLKEYQEALTRLRVMNDAPLLHTLIFVGAYCRRADDYGEAQKYLSEALGLSEPQSDLRALVLANLGSLSYTMDDFVPAIKFYREASTIYRNNGNHEAVRTTLHLAIMSEEVKDWKDGKISYTAQRFAEYDTLSERSDFLTIHQLYLDGLQDYSDELFQENSKGPYTRRLSSNVGEANRQVEFAAYIADHLGNALYQKQLYKNNGISLFNSGVLRDEPGLLDLSLGLFVLTNYKEGIRAIVNKYFSLKSRDEVDKFVEWLLSIKGDRDALLGMINTFKEYAPYVSDRHIPIVFDRLLELSNLGYSFLENFDFERPCIQAIENIAPRLNWQKLEPLIDRYKSRLKEDPPLMKEEIAGMFGRLPWGIAPLAIRNEILDIAKSELHGKTWPSKDKLLILICNISQGLPEITLEETAQLLYKHISSESFISAPYLSTPWIKKHLTDKQIYSIVEELLNKLENELKSSSLNSFGFGGFDYILSLEDFFVDASGEQRKRIISYLTNSLRASNTWPEKKTSAALFIKDNAAMYTKDEKDILADALKSVIYEPYTDEDKKRILSFDFFRAGDFVRLMSNIISALEKLNPGLGTNYFGLLRDATTSIDSVSGPSVISALGEIALINSNTPIGLQCLDLLYFCSSNLLPPNCQSSAIRWFGRIVKENPNLEIVPNIVSRMEVLSKHKHYQVRMAVAQAVNSIGLSEKISVAQRITLIRTALGNDIHYSVRLTVKQNSSGDVL